MSPLPPGCAVRLVDWPVRHVALHAAEGRLQTSAAPVNTLHNAGRIVTNSPHKWLLMFSGLFSLHRTLLIILLCAGFFVSATNIIAII